MRFCNPIARNQQRGCENLKTMHKALFDQIVSDPDNVFLLSADSRLRETMVVRIEASGFNIEL